LNIRQYAKNIRLQSEQFAEVVSACKSLFNHSPRAEEARVYMQTRLSKHSIDKFGIGYFPDNKNLDDLISLVGEKTLKDLNLIKDGVINNRSHIDQFKKGFFNQNNIIFPFKDEYGNIVALAGRTLLGKKEQLELKVPKYKNTVFGKSMHLYGLYNTKDAIERNGSVIVVEGQIDCIACHANGFFNTVALTCSELTLYQLYTLKKMTNQIYLLLDNDEAGRKAASKTISRFSKYIQIKKLPLPNSYNDVDDYLRSSAQHDIFDVCYQSGGA